MGSGRLAARFFTPIPLLTPAQLLAGSSRCCRSPPRSIAAGAHDRPAATFAPDPGRAMTESTRESTRPGRVRIPLLLALALIAAIAGLGEPLDGRGPPARSGREGTGLRGHLSRPRSRPRRSRRGSMCCSGRIARRPSRGSGRTGSGRSRSSRWTPWDGSRASRCGSMPRRSVPRPARPDQAREICRAGRGPAQPRHAQASATARGTPTGRSCTPGSIRRRGGTIALKVDKIVPPRRFPSSDRIKLVELTEPEALGLLSPRDQASGGRHLAEGPRRGGASREAAGALHHPRVRRRSFHGPADGGEPAVGHGQRVHPGLARPRLRDRSPRVRRQRDQRPPRRGAGRGVHPLHREDLPGGRRSRRPAPDRPFLRGLEQPLAPGDLSGRLRRDLVDQPRPGRFPRLPADRPVCRGREHVPRPQGAAPADRPDGEDPRALVRRLLADGRRHRLGRAARLVRGGLQPARSRRPAAQALGPVHRRRRPRRRQDVGSLRHPAGAGAELADARPEAQGEAARDHRRPRYVLPRRGREVAQGVARPGWAATRASRSSPTAITARCWIPRWRRDWIGRCKRRSPDGCPSRKPKP